MSLLCFVKLAFMRRHEELLLGSCLSQGLFNPASKSALLAEQFHLQLRPFLLMLSS